MKIKIATAQYPITWHSSFEDWAVHTEKWVAEAAFQKAGLLLFPEYGAMELVSIFPEEVRRDIHTQVREMDRLRTDFYGVFSRLAAKYNVTLVSPSLPVSEGDKIYNRSYVFSAKGKSGYQDKFFMTRFENEIWGISSAPKILTVFEQDWGAFGIQICYDAEFAIGSQCLGSSGAGVILMPSCTETIRGATRVHIGARARALENQLYTVVSQVIGEAPWSPAVDINYGYAAVYTTPDVNMPEEGVVSVMTPQAVGWLYQDLDLSLIETVRTEGQVFNYKDHSGLKSAFKDQEVIIQKLIL